MSDEDNTQPDQNAPQQSSTPPTSPSSAPSPTPQPGPDTSKHAAPEEEPAGNEDQAYLDKHASLKDRSGEGAPGDISGVRMFTEAGYSHPGDYSSETGRS